MAYDDVKGEFGHEPVYILDLALDICSNVFSDGTGGGGGFCQATGEPCYQTFPTCKDTPNFDAANLNPFPDNPVTKQIYRFSNKRIDELQGNNTIATFPTIVSVKTSPTKLDPGKGLGVRSSVQISVVDHPWTDRGTDPYVDQRTYDPTAQGSFWGRFLGRNEFYESRLMTIKTGYLTADGVYDPSNFIERLYIITKIAGPDYNGNVIIEGKDPLKFADDDRAQWPPAPVALLDGDIGFYQTNITYIDNGANLVDWCDIGGANEQKYLRIDDEVMEVSAITATDITVIRGSMPSFYDAATNVGADHSTGASIQQCYLYEDEPIEEVYYQLLNTAAGLETTFLPLVDWQAKITESGYQAYVMNRLLVESNGVKKYLEELTQLNVYVWWDEREQVIKMGTLLPGELPTIVFNEDENIKDGSIVRTYDTKGRLNEFWLGYAHINPTKNMDEHKHFSDWRIPVNQTSQSKVENNDRKIRKVVSPWLSLNQQAVATEIANRVLIDNRKSKNMITMTLTPKDDDQWTDDSVAVSTRLVQDIASGANEILGYKILEVNEQLDVSHVEYSYLLKESATFDRTGVIAPDCDPTPGEGILEDNGDIVLDDGDEICDDPFPAYADASQDLRSRYIFIAYDHAPDPPGNPLSPPGFNDGTPPYQIQ